MSRISGLDRLRDRLTQAPAALQPLLASAVGAAAARVADEAVSALARGQASGRLYVRRGRAYRASAPGEAPASARGRLAHGIVVESDGLSARVIVGPSTGADYAAALEFGTARMAARPFLLPAIERARPRVAETIAAAARSAIASIGR